MPFSSPVAEYMTPDPVVVGWDTPIIEAAILMDNLHVRHLPVTRGGRVVGVLTVEAVLGASRRLGRLPGDVRAGDAPGVLEAVWVEASTPVSRAARLMVERGVDALLVGSPGGLAGVFTARDVVRASVGELHDLPVIAVARSLPVAGLGDSVGSAVDSMLARGVRHVIVVDSDGFIAGIHSVRDALALLLRAGGGVFERRVVEAMSPHVYTIDPGASAGEAIEVMSDRDIGALPLASRGRPFGAVTERDVVEAAARQG